MKKSIKEAETKGKWVQEISQRCLLRKRTCYSFVTPTRLLNYLSFEFSPEGEGGTLRRAVRPG